MRSAPILASIVFAVAAIVAASGFVTPAAANPAFAQAAGGANCSTCHMPGQETSAPNSGFTSDGQKVYNAFQTQGTDCYQSINRAVSSVLSGVPGTACVPSGGTNNNQPQPNYPPQPNYQPQTNYPPQPQPNYPPQPQPQPQPYYPPQPNYQPQTNYPPQPQPQPYYPPQPSYQPQTNYPPQPQPQPYYPPQPQPNYPQQPTGPQKFTFTDSSCLFSKSFFIVRLGGDPNQEMRFMLKNGHSVRVEAPYGTTFEMRCGKWPKNYDNFSPAQ